MIEPRGSWLNLQASINLEGRASYQTEETERTYQLKYLAKEYFFQIRRRFLSRVHGLHEYLLRLLLAQLGF